MYNCDEICTKENSEKQIEAEMGWRSGQRLDKIDRVNASSNCAL